MNVWIRVDSGIGDSARVLRFAAALKIPLESAVGFLVMLWGQVATHRCSGDLSDVLDGQIEHWAKWHGRRGRFAQAFKVHFMVDGQINDWTHHQGALIDRRTRDRERWEQRKSARHSAGVSAEPPLATEDGDGNETEPNSSTLLPPAGLLDRIARHPGRWAIIEFLENLPAGQSVPSWSGVLNGCLDGLGTPGNKPATINDLSAACSDYRAVAPEKWAPIHFRKFVARVMGSHTPAQPAGRTDRAVEAARKFAQEGS